MLLLYTQSNNNIIFQIQKGCVFATSFSLKAAFSEASVSKVSVSQKLLHLSKANSQSIVLSDMMCEMTLNDSVESLATAVWKMW